jgi:diguanylate cyclase (GGDEF)-like protein
LKDKGNKNLTRWIVLLPLLGVFITAIILVQVFINYEKTIYQHNLDDAHTSIIKHNKLMGLERISDIEDVIRAKLDARVERSKDTMKYLTNFSSLIVENIYNEYKFLPKGLIVQKVQETLNESGFLKNLKGQFFIYDKSGMLLLQPSDPSQEGKNLLNSKDAKGNFTVKTITNISSKNGQAFEEWYLQNNEMKKKIGYASEFKPLGIFIGLLVSENDIVQNSKKEIQNYLMNKRFSQSGYVFAYDYNGTTISHIVKEYIDINRWFTLVEGGYRIPHLVRGAKIIPEGFFISNAQYFNTINGKKVENKITYIKDIPQLGWIIGISTYNAYILDEIEKNRQTLKAKLAQTVTQIIYLTLSILILMLLVTLFLSSKLKKVFNTYRQTLMDKNRQTTEQKQQIIFQLEHDYLTGLPNRILLEDRLKQTISHAQREEKTAAVLFIDIDRFKTINDSLGHDAGDTLLIEIAKRLKKSIRESDTAARLGGDEFIVLINGHESMYDVTNVVEKINKEIKKEILIDNKSHYISVSIGISIFPNDGKSSQTLLKNADIAMYKAKENGRDQYKFFTEQINKELQKSIEMERALHVAIENREFVLHYQPIVNINTSQIVGVEALVRWQHPTKGLILPDEFIPIAEESSLIIDMGNWIINEAMTQMSQWKEKGYTLEKISINVAGRQLEDKRFILNIKDALEANSCKPEWIEVEVIERFLMKNTKKTISILETLRAMNIDIALDDFGTGYSSLAYLKQLPITKLKIDRAFVKNIMTSFEDRAIAKAIIALGLGLNLKVLAEGVETKEEKDFFSVNGCNLVQGYFYSKPLPLCDLEKLLEIGEIK